MVMMSAWGWPWPGFCSSPGHRLGSGPGGSGKCSGRGHRGTVDRRVEQLLDSGSGSDRTAAPGTWDPASADFDEARL